MTPLARDDILRLLERLNDELARDGVCGELYRVGGAVLCLAFDARRTTVDLDGFFRPSREMRAAARRVAAAEGLADDWLNDAAKGFLGGKEDFRQYLALSHLNVLTAGPEYPLAMKCLAMRLGGEFHDREDVRFLLRYLNVTRREAALEIVGRYYPLEKIPQKTFDALAEMIEDLAAAQGVEPLSSGSPAPRQKPRERPR